MLRGAVALLALVLPACSDEAERFCQLGSEHSIASSVALEYDDVALLPRDGGVTAFWSEPGGLFARLLDGEGRPHGPALRLGAHCAGGFDVLARGAGYELACLVPATDGKEGQRGGVQLLRITAALTLERTRLLGEAGPLSSGIDLAPAAGGLGLAWHDGAPDAHRVWWVSLAPGAEPPRVISTDGRMAAAPSIGVRDAELRVAWAERWLEQGQLHSRVALWDGRGNPHTVLPVAHLQAMPQLLTLPAIDDSGEAQHLLAYRDRRGRTDRTGLYLSRVAGRGELVGEIARVGRADGAGRPALTPCMGGLVTATPRTYGGDYFVGINWLDHGLERVRGEQQFYEDTHAFSRAAAACIGDHAVILIAEYADLHDADGAALRTVPYRCR